MVFGAIESAETGRRVAITAQEGAMMQTRFIDIRIGTMVRANLDDPAAYIRQILPLGFESIQPFFWQTLGGKDLPRLAGQIRDAIGDADVIVSLARHVRQSAGERRCRSRDAARPGKR